MRRRGWGWVDGGGWSRVEVGVGWGGSVGRGGGEGEGHEVRAGCSVKATGRTWKMGCFVCAGLGLVEVGRARDCYSCLRVLDSELCGCA